MNASERKMLSEHLHSRRDAVAAAWLNALTLIGYGSYSLDAFRESFAALVDKSSSCLLDEELASEKAQEIGAWLAREHRANIDALGRSIGILSGELLKGLNAEQSCALQPALASLLEGVAVGHAREASRLSAAKQEPETNLAGYVDEQREIEALRRSEARHQDILSSLHDTFVVVFDREGRYTSIWGDAQISERYGIDPDNFLGKRLADMFPTEFAAQRLAELQQVFDSGQSVRTEFELAHPKGSFWQDVSYAPLGSENGNVASVAAVVRDITERKRAESALLRSERQYRTLLDSVRDGVYALDLTGRFVFVNDVILNRSGFSREWFLERYLWDVVYPEYRELARQGFIAVAKGCGGQLHELATQTAKGDQLWVEVSSTLMTEGDQITGVLGISRDISQRRQAERDLRESEERWRSLVTHAPDKIIEVDRDGHIHFINRMPGWLENSTDAELRCLVLDLVMPEYHDALGTAIQRVWDTGGSEYLEVMVADRGAAPRWCAIRAGAVAGKGGVRSVMLVAQDITEGRQLSDMKDSLVRDVSHELRTPLAKMHMSLELLLELLADDPLDSARATGLAERSLGNVTRLMTTVESILDLSSLESGMQPYNMESLDLSELLEEVVLYMESFATAQGVKIRWESCSIALPPVRGDSAKLFRVLTNLIENALKFSHGGKVEIRARRVADEVEVAVQDWGDGIRVENLGRVFERFFQEKNRFQGVGVGLAICKTIVEGHHGRIWAESEGKGEGATFRFTLPISE